LLVLCGVGHSILQLAVRPDGTLTAEQADKIRQLAALDWSRKGSLWKDYLVGSHGNVTPHKNHIVLAVARVKQALGLPIAPKEAGILQKVSESMTGLTV